MNAKLQNTHKKLHPTTFIRQRSSIIETWSSKTPVGAPNTVVKAASFILTFYHRDSSISTWTLNAISRPYRAGSICQKNHSNIYTRKRKVGFIFKNKWETHNVWWLMGIVIGIKELVLKDNQLHFKKRNTPLFTWSLRGMPAATVAIMATSTTIQRVLMICNYVKYVNKMVFIWGKTWMYDPGRDRLLRQKFSFAHRWSKYLQSY